MSEPPKMSIGWLLIVYVALMILLLSTVGFAELPLGTWALIVALAIAVAKALLVITYYMHVRFSSRITIIFVIAGFLWLSIMLVLSEGDYVSRGWLYKAEPLSRQPVTIPPPLGMSQEPPASPRPIDFQRSPNEHNHNE